jgi:hypothetical protein
MKQLRHLPHPLRSNFLRVGPVQCRIVIIVINIIHNSSSYCKMPRQIGLAVLRRPSPPPLSRVLLGEVVIAPKEAVKPIITKCSY